MKYQRHNLEPHVLCYPDEGKKKGGKRISLEGILARAWVSRGRALIGMEMGLPVPADGDLYAAASNA